MTRIYFSDIKGMLHYFYVRPRQSTRHSTCHFMNVYGSFIGQRITNNSFLENEFCNTTDRLTMQDFRIAISDQKQNTFQGVPDWAPCHFSCA
jgi:hypothetical protein